MGEKRGVHARSAALLLALLLLVPAAAFGDAGDFVPTIYSSHGDFELNMMRQSDENTSGGRGTRSSDSFASERLLLYLDGYVYHPRFIQFLMRGAGGFSQERYENNQAESFTDNAVSTDYEFRMKILPEHPYNLELYTLRTTPLLRMSSAETRPTSVEKGAIFDYANRPLFFNMSYSTGETKARISSSEYRNQRASGSYVTGPFNNTAAYSHTDSSTSLGMHISNDYSSFENTIKMGALSLNSKVSEGLVKQTSPFAATLDTDTLSWTEQFNAELPWNFFTSASYNFLNNSLITEETGSTPRRELATETKSAGFILAHKLYDSVRTYYSMNRTSSETSSGDTQSLTNSLNGIYTKKVPDGRVTVGAQGSRASVNRNNAPLFVGETYNAPLFGTFTITREGIDPATISIKVISDTGALVNLVQNVNYVLEFSGNSVTVTIVLLPPQIMSGHPIGHVYAFHATYTLVASTVEFETTSVGYSINLTLFDNLINPYYSRLHMQQVVLAGYIPGGAQESDTKVIGVTIQKAPYALVTEERIIESNISPSRSLRNAVQYAKRMSDTLNLSAKAEHSKTINGPGLLGTSGYTEQVSSLNVMITKYVPRQKLTASLAGTYSQRRATIDTVLHAITGNLTWKLAALSVDMGATINRAESTGTGERQTMLSEFYYLTLSRRLF